MGAQFRILLHKVQGQAGFEWLVVLAPPEDLAGSYIIPEQIIGKLLDPTVNADGSPRLAPENFARNGVFVDLLHGVIASQGPFEASLVAEAHAKGDGFVDFMDGRAEVDQISAEDIFGRFRVSDGVIVPRSYERNQEHRIFSQRGFFQLPLGVQTLLADELTLLLMKKEKDIRPRPSMN